MWKQDCARLSRLHQSALPQPSAPVCVVAGLRVPPGVRRAWLRPGWRPPALARRWRGQREEARCGETPARGGTCKGALFFLYSAGHRQDGWLGRAAGTAGAARVQAFGLAAEQVDELLDFYHAVQHLGQVVALRRDWSAKARTRWRTQQRRLLLRGQVEQVITAVGNLCRGRHSKAILKHRDYFIKNQHRMAYARLLAMKLPIGSGAIESTVRRVVNLRLKGPSLFWCRANAEAILLLRSYYKAGRWNKLKRMATSPLALLET